MKKWELSILAGVLATMIWCAAVPHLELRWWTTAFSPLCDGILTTEDDGGEVVLQSKLWELLMEYWPAPKQQEYGSD